MPLQSQREEKDWGKNNIFEEIMPENFSYLVKEINIQIYEAQQIQTC